MFLKVSREFLSLEFSISIFTLLLYRVELDSFRKIRKLVNYRVGLIIIQQISMWYFENNSKKILSLYVYNDIINN